MSSLRVSYKSFSIVFHLEKEMGGKICNQKKRSEF
jgi:hypothetical protein